MMLASYIVPGITFNRRPPSRRDRMIVARHEVPGIRKRDDTSRRDGMMVASYIVPGMTPNNGQRHGGTE